MVKDILHDVPELAVDFFKRPTVTLAVLAHFQRARGDATRIGGLCGPKQHAVFQQIFRSFQRGGHVGALANCTASVFDQHLCVLEIQFVLGRARQRHITRDVPYAATFVVFRIGAVILVSK